MGINVLTRLREGAVPSVGDYGSPVRFGAEGHAMVRALLGQDSPAFITRLGASELRALTYAQRWRRLGMPYPRMVRREMRINAGFFPTTDAALDRFATEFGGALTEATLVGVWFNPNEHRIIRRYCPHAALVELGCLEPMRFAEPWSACFAGKTVLIVHPFAHSIERQYAKRRLLFADPEVLPDFELRTLPAVQSIAGNTGGYLSWFDALAAMQEQVAMIDFDVAVIGAGAYGLPLGAFVRGIGRTAIHLGAATQILFGIIGRRWETEYRDTLGHLINPHWVRPLPEEVPPHAELVEGGAYW